MTTRLTIVPFLVAFFAAVAAMPTNVYQVCAWNAGTLAVDAWRSRSMTAVRKVAAGIRAWLASVWSPRVAFACAAVLFAILLAQHAGVGHDGVMFGALTPTLLARRAQLLREVAALKNADGTFLSDEARASTDTKITEIEELNAKDSEQSATIAERDAVDVTAPKALPTEPNDRDAGAAAERARVQGIITAARAARLPASFSDELIRGGAALVDAQSAVFAELAKRDGAAYGPKVGSGPAHEVRFGGDDPLVHVRSGIENALLHRSAPDRFKLDDNGKRYRGMSMLDIGRVFLKARGARVTDMSRSELVDAMLTRAGLHSTVDFPGLFEDAANKNLRSSYEAAPQTWREISRMVSLSDFKPSRQLQVGDAPALLEILEHGEYTFGTIGEAKESVQLKTYGRMFGITRQALINDDLNAFSEVPAAFGRKARDIESDLAWAQITSNPTMGDSVALFHATHANLTSSGTAIAVASLGVGRTALRKQTGIDAATLLNLMARYLIVPAALETIADQYLTQITAALSSSVNPFATGSGRTPLTPIVEPRLDANSATAWYMATDQAQAPVLYHGVLDGQEGPLVTQMEGFDVDGMKFRCRIDVAFKAADYRAIYKNVGA